MTVNTKGWTPDLTSAHPATEYRIYDLEQNGRFSQAAALRKRVEMRNLAKLKDYGPPIPLKKRNLKAKSHASRLRAALDAKRRQG